MLYRVGGLLVVVASVGFGTLLALAQAGQPVEALDNPLTAGLFYLSAVSGGLGSWWVGRHGTIQGEGVFGRFGLGLLAVGLLAMVAGQLLVTFIPSQGDQSADPAFLVIAGGYLSVLAGQIVIGLAFIVRGGLPRVIGCLFLAGPGVVVLSLPLRPGNDIAPILRVAGLAIVLVGWLWLGALAMRSDEGPKREV